MSNDEASATQFSRRQPAPVLPGSTEVKHHSGSRPLSV